MPDVRKYLLQQMMLSAKYSKARKQMAADRSTTIQVRLSPEEKAVIEETAYGAGLTVSAWARFTLKAAAKMAPAEDGGDDDGNFD